MKLKNPIVIVCFAISSCSAPRTILESGKVTPHKQIKAGIDFSANFATQPIKALKGSSSEIIESLANKDSIVFDDALNKLNIVALAYSLDPLGSGFNMYARYGLFKKMDIGYKFASGTHVFDSRYQFMGPTSTGEDTASGKKYGSIGLQFSSQSYDLPLGLDKLQGILGLEFKRKDFLVPLIFSYSFGKEENYGAISYGLVYSHSFVSYSFDPQKIYEAAGPSGISVNKTLIKPINEKKNFPAFGTFTNIRFGYKYVYGLLSFSMYYQNYGTFNLLGGNTVKFNGFSFVPSAGLYFIIPPKKIFKKQK